MNKIDLDNYNKQYYLSVWKEMLKEFLGWSEVDVIHWAKETWTEEVLDNPDDIFYHQTPQYWITYLLIPASLKTRLSSEECIEFEQRLLLAFKDKHHYNFPEDTDWRPYKARIEQILSEYGERLAAIPA